MPQQNVRQYSKLSPKWDKTSLLDQFELNNITNIMNQINVY